MEGPAFEVLDALGLARLVKRTPLLDGAVPLRVAQGCVPLLEGNAFGFQVVFTEKLRARRRLAGPSVELEPDVREKLAAAHAGAIPRLVAQGFLREGSAWAARLKDRFYWVEREGLARWTLRVWTGLLVRPRSGAWLRVSSTANRRNLTFSVREQFVGREEWTPLIIDLSLERDEVLLSGEVACIAPVLPGVRVAVLPLERAPALGAAHAAFYDEKYFATKKGDVTKKYRKLVQRESAPATERPPLNGAATLTIATLGEARLAVKRIEQDGRALEHVVFENEVGFAASYDGHTLEVTPDARALAAGAERVERAWRAVYGEESIARDRRALWYLTKYFTPHPPGEPHFFVKPWAFVKTPPGWSSLVEGVNGAGYDVWRGVVSTDVFHATPAVFALHGAGRISVGAGEPLIAAFAVPRWLARAGYEMAKWLDAP